MAKPLSQRQRKVGEQLRHIIGQEFINHDLGYVSVMEVRPSPDLRSARVYVCAPDDFDLQELQKMAYMFQNAINKNTHMKFTPRLRFVPDDTLDNARHIEDILRQIPKKKDSFDGKE